MADKKKINATIQVKRATTAKWTEQNPVLKSGEWGYDTDKKIYKMGDGETAWNSLPTPQELDLRDIQEQVNSNTAKITDLETLTTTHTNEIATLDSGLESLGETINKNYDALNARITENETDLTAIDYVGGDQNATDVAGTLTCKSNVNIDGQLYLPNGSNPTNDNYAVNKKYVGSAITSALGSVYTYKGSVASQSALPTSGNKTGDVYNVEDTGMNYAWNGSEWDSLGSTIEIKQETGTSTTATISQNAITNELAKKSTATNIVNGTGAYGSLNQKFVVNGYDFSAVASGQNAVAFNGLRADKVGVSGATQTPTSAEGVQSFAAGASTHAYGAYSATFNKDNVAYGIASACFGGSNQAGHEDAALTDFSLAFCGGGEANKATGRSAFIGGGSTNTVTGQNSATAGGWQNEVSGANAFATGANNKVTDSQSAIVGGNDSECTGQNSFIGGGVSNKSYQSFAAMVGGNTNTVNGVAAAVIGGTSNTATGTNSFIAGGNSNQATANNTFATGLGTIANNAEMAAFGRYNKGDSNSIFEIGVGTSTTKKNALAVKNVSNNCYLYISDDSSYIRGSDGAIVFSGEPVAFKSALLYGGATLYNTPTNDSDAVTKSYVDNNIPAVIYHNITFQRTDNSVYQYRMMIITKRGEGLSSFSSGAQVAAHIFSCANKSGLCVQMWEDGTTYAGFAVPDFSQSTKSSSVKFIGVNFLTSQATRETFTISASTITNVVDETVII